MMRWKFKKSEDDVHGDETSKICCVYKKKMDSEENVLPAELRIVLIGRVGAEKTSVMKTILRSSEEPAPQSGTCPSQKVQVQGQNVVVIDTPGLCSVKRNEEEVVNEIKERVSLAAPGPHVFLFVLDLDRFTKEVQDAVDVFKKTFGKKVVSYTMVLFTCEDELSENEKDMQEFIKKNKDLKNFVSECKDRHHVMDNTDQEPTQVTQLLQKINAMVQENEGTCYTAKMIQEAEKESSRLRKRVTLSIKAAALAGAVLGGAVSSYFAGDLVGISVTAGILVGAVLGGVGVVAAENIKTWFE